MDKSKNINENVPVTLGTIVSPLRLNKSTNGIVFCFFRLKREIGGKTDFISVKSWGIIAEGIVKLLQNGDDIEIVGHFMPEFRDRKIKVLSDNGRELIASLTEEKDGNLTIRIKNGSSAEKPPAVKYCDRYIFCDKFIKVNKTQGE